jgi:aldehyde dehydrogenase (NAD+)
MTPRARKEKKEPMYERSTVFIDNENVPSAGEHVDVISPATEEQVGGVTLASMSDVDKAVASARRAFDDGPWPRLSVDERRGSC